MVTDLMALSAYEVKQLKLANTTKSVCNSPAKLQEIISLDHMVHAIHEGCLAVMKDALQV